MSKHHKPTKEELKAEMEKSVKELETLPQDPVTPPSDPQDPPADPPVTPPTDPQDPPQDPVTPPPAPVVPDLATVRTKKPEELTEEDKAILVKHVAELTDEEKTAFGVVKKDEKNTDWEQKFKASAREARLIGLKNTELNKAIESASELTPPTDEEMTAIYPTWDELDDFQKSIARDNQLSKRKFDLIQGATAKFKDIDEWRVKVESFVTDPQVLIDNPDLEGKEDDFRDFAIKPSRRGIDFEDLLLAFKGDRAANPPKQNKGQMFETGGSRAPIPPKPVDTRLSPEEGEVIRKSDYKRFVQLLKAGKIRTE